MTRRYAEGTRVPIEQSQAEIRGLLARHGVINYATAEGLGTDGKYRSAIQFVLGGLPYRFDVVRPTADEVRDDYQRRRRPGMPYHIDAAGKADAEWRRRWRARLLWLKSTLEFAVGESDGEVERLLLAYLVLPDQKTTMAQYAERELPGAYAEGRMPALQLTGGK